MKMVKGKDGVGAPEGAASAFVRAFRDRRAVDGTAASGAATRSALATLRPEQRPPMEVAAELAEVFDAGGHDEAIAAARAIDRDTFDRGAPSREPPAPSVPEKSRPFGVLDGGAGRRAPDRRLEELTARKASDADQQALRAALEWLLEGYDELAPPIGRKSPDDERARAVARSAENERRLEECLRSLRGTPTRPAKALPVATAADLLVQICSHRTTLERLPAVHRRTVLTHAVRIADLVVETPKSGVDRLLMLSWLRAIELFAASTATSFDDDVAERLTQQLRRFDRPRLHALPTHRDAKTTDG
jgi:hypothetical protein